MRRSTKREHTDATAAEYRERLAAVIAAALQRDPRVRAIGEGGAAARGRADAYSDLDLFVVAALEEAPALFGKVEAAIASVTPITHTWHVDPPGFPNIAQRFYVVADAPRFFAVDCCVVNESGLAPFLERERHGNFVAWSDPKKLLVGRRADRSALTQRRKHRLAQLHEAIPVFAMLLEKELARGNVLEALGRYQTLLGFLIELLGMRHRPERFDFGWRYVDRELPETARAVIARHSFVGDGAALPRLVTSLVSELNAQLADIEAAAVAPRS